jgi:hypothetical protein
MDSGRVVWSRQFLGRSYTSREILVYDAVAGSGPVGISDPSLICTAPRVADGKVVYQQVDTDGSATLMVYDFAQENPVSTPAGEDFTWYHGGHADHGQLVTSRFSGSDRDIFFRGPGADWIALTDNDLDDRSPVISGNHVSWISGDAVYLAEISSLLQVQALEVQEPLSTSFTAAWQVLCNGVEKYILDVAEDPEFTSFVPGYQGLDVGSVNEYPVTGLTRGATLYYRLTAMVNGQPVAQGEGVQVSLPLRDPCPGCHMIPVYRLLLR